MTVKSAKYIIIALSILLANSIFAQNTQAYAAIDTNAIMIGDQTMLEIGLKIPENSKFIWPEIGDTITKQIEVLEKSNIDTTFNEGQMIINQKFKITSFDSGYFELPSFTFIYGIDSLQYSNSSPPLYLQVNTPIVDTTQAIKPIVLPYSEPYTFMEILPWALGGITLVAAILFTIWFFIRRKKNKPLFVAKPKPLKPADIVALEKLGELRLAKVWQQGKVKEYHSKLTDIMREYLNRRFSFNALEMTSDEIKDELQLHLKNEEAMSKLNSVFMLSDLVKFAKSQPTPLENDLSITHCIDFVEETKFRKQVETVSNKVEGGSNV
ncbi:MAG: hypothetical protein C0598_01110 [Marinilabiliales bacterium]|nr:MAG: hypothetical protein C0598_01110 [Marinilabiliales bacterium]